MKAIHWSPIENHDSILEKGLLIKDTWMHANILTPFHKLNRWWLDFYLDDKDCLGYIFELQETDLPCVYAHWAGHREHEYDENDNLISTFRKPLDYLIQENPEEETIYRSLSALKQGYQESILWRIGETFDECHDQESEVYIPNALQHIKENPTAIHDFLDNPDFLLFTFEDYELMLPHDIAPERIIKVVQPDEVYQYKDVLEEMRAKFVSSIQKSSPKYKK